jgi:hypothetical protein
VLPFDNAFNWVDLSLRRDVNPPRLIRKNNDGQTTSLNRRETRHRFNMDSLSLQSKRACCPSYSDTKLQFLESLHS